MSLPDLLDPYTWKARVYPALLVSAPLLVTGTAMLYDRMTEFSAMVSVLASAGILYLLSHLVRQAGKSKEPPMWRRWGGKPTTVSLRWRTPDPPIPQDIIRARLSHLVPDVSLPTEEEERADPANADRQYEAAVSALREATRERSRFPIVFAENVAYGYRRNAWAVKPAGLLSCAVALGIGILEIVGPLGIDPDRVLLPLATAAVVDVLLLGFWLFVATERWVMQAANMYTVALLSATSIALNRTADGVISRSH